MDLKERQKRQLIIILIIIIVFGGLFSSIKLFKQRTFSTREMTSVKLQSGFQTKDVGAINFDNGFSKFDLFYDSNNQWKIKVDNKDNKLETFADNIKVDEWLKKLVDLESIELVTSNKESFGSYYLGTGQGTKLTFKTKPDGKELLTFVVGKAGEATNSSYVLLKDKIYSYTSDFFETARKDYKEWRSLRMMQMKTEDVTDVTMKFKTNAWSVKFVGDKWIYGDGSAADGGKIISWLATARDTQATQIVDNLANEKMLPKDWAAVTDQLVITFKDKSQFVLRMSKGDGTDWFVKNFNTQVIYKVSEPILATMMVPKDNFKPKPEEKPKENDSKTDSKKSENERYGTEKPKLKMEIK